MTQKLSADLKWDRGKGTETERDEEQGTQDGMKREGEAPAEPKRQPLVTGDRGLVRLDFGSPLGSSSHSHPWIFCRNLWTGIFY